MRESETRLKSSPCRWAAQRGLPSISRRNLVSVSTIRRCSCGSNQSVNPAARDRSPNQRHRGAVLSLVGRDQLAECVPSTAVPREWVPRQAFSDWSRLAATAAGSGRSGSRWRSRVAGSFHRDMEPVAAGRSTAAGSEVRKVLAAGAVHWFAAVERTSHRLPRQPLGRG